MNFFDQLPNELVQIILIKSTTLDNYASVRKTCQRFKILLEDGGYLTDGAYQFS